MKRIFQGLVILLLSLTVVIEALAWFYLPDDPALVAAMQMDGGGALFLLNLPLYFFVLAVYVIVTAALLSFDHRARTLFTIVILANVLLTLVYGLRFTLPLQNFLGYLLSLAEGAVLAIIYFTSVAREFGSDAA